MRWFEHVRDIYNLHDKITRANIIIISLAFALGVTFSFFEGYRINLIITTIIITSTTLLLLFYLYIRYIVIPDEKNESDLSNIVENVDGTLPQIDMEGYDITEIFKI